MSRKWLKGDTHLHTLNSDGSVHQYELIERCKKLGLDYAIITDHNYNTVEKSYSSDGLTVIQGQELTGELGHINVWGEKIPFEPPYDLENIEAYKKITDKAKKNGATISVNHPFCSMCGFHMDIDDYEMDCVEVWNTIQHSDNTKNMAWWVKKLNEGKKIGAVGGSDWHKDYIPGVNMLAMPCTITYAKSNSPDDILEALREGRSVVTNTPNSSMIYLTVGDKTVGDTVEFDENLTGKCKVTKLLPSYVLKIYNNNKLIYQHRASKYEKEFEVSFDIKEKGYIRAQIDFTMAKPLKALFQTVEQNYLGSKEKAQSTMFWAFTNPIWID